MICSLKPALATSISDNNDINTVKGFNVNGIDGANGINDKKDDKSTNSVKIIVANITGKNSSYNPNNVGNNNITHNDENNVKTKSNTQTKTKLEDGCCSVILHVNSSSYVYGYRRDSSYAANLYIKKVKLYGIEALKEYKTTNTYFFHSLIFKNGWYIGAGGSDNPSVNRYLEKLGGQMVYKKTITMTYMKKAMKKVRSLGLGHFVIKSPGGKVGVAIYNGGSSKLSVFRMKEGEYLSIPNSPRLFRKGTYTVKKSSPVDAAIYIAGTDRFGVNRRNIMIYNVTNIKYTSKTTTNITTKTTAKTNTNSATKTITKSITKTNTKTKIKIWTSNDNGKYVGRNTAKKADNIIFKGKKILASSIPKIPYKKYVGELVLN